MEKQSELNKHEINAKDFSTICFYLARYCRLEIEEIVSREQKLKLKGLAVDFQKLEEIFDNLAGCWP
ncbi:MAG TPA: hypothetical protein VMW25_06320 [Clostridia bacterium]|nr:hypothetical protein [Clostridia bacterium]